MTTEKSTSEEVKTPSTVGENIEDAELVEAAQAKAGAEDKAKVVEPVAKPPEPKTYTAEEWGKRESAKDKEVATERDKATAAEERAKESDRKHEELLQQGEEQRLASWLKSVESEGGDVIRAREIADATKESSKQARELRANQATLEREKVTVEAGLKTLTANQLVKQHELGEDALGTLMEASDPKAMEVEALKLALEKAKTGQKPAMAVDSTTGKTVVDTSKMTDEQSLGNILEGLDAEKK